MQIIKQCGKKIKLLSLGPCWCVVSKVAGSPPPLWGGKASPNRTFGKEDKKAVKGSDTAGTGTSGGTAWSGRGGRGMGSTGGVGGMFGTGIGKKAPSPRRHSLTPSANGKFPPPPPPGSMTQAGGLFRRGTAVVHWECKSVVSGAGWRSFACSFPCFKTATCFVGAQVSAPVFHTWRGFQRLRGYLPRRDRRDRAALGAHFAQTVGSGLLATLLCATSATAMPLRPLVFSRNGFHIFHSQPPLAPRILAWHVFHVSSVLIFGRRRCYGGR